MTIRDKRIGEESINRLGTPMKIIDYGGVNDVTVEFLDEYHCKRHTTYSNFKSGSVNNLYDKTLFGVGYLGEGKYKCSINNFMPTYYKTWKSLMKRIYYKNDIRVSATYDDCVVCNEWHNLQNFAKWFEENYYEIGEGRMHLDKDIICAGNKIYNPDMCIFVPQRINMIFMSRVNRKYNLPTGIHKSNGGEKYNVMYNTTYLGSYDDLDKATSIYKAEKRKHIKNVADEYKNRIPTNVYDILINW